MIDLCDSSTTVIEESIETQIITSEIIDLIPGVGPIFVDGNIVCGLE